MSRRSTWLDQWGRTRRINPVITSCSLRPISASCLDARTNAISSHRR
ncbi:MAG TPA: hypothetical protein DCL15_03575 [Chloroflexi bacterium]|nr:hypothetical protein [Chloroflexota bacterium]